MKILVTGGCGLIGSALCRRLVANSNYTVFNVDTLTYAAEPRSLTSIEACSNCHFVHGDICNSELFLDLLQSQQIEGIIHLAAESHVDRSILSPSVFFRRIIWLLITCCRQVGPTLKLRRISGELEITSGNQTYLDQQNLAVQTLYRGFAWMDAGTIDDLMGTADFVRQIEKWQGQKICCPEEMCLNNCWLGEGDLEALISAKKQSDYNSYVQSAINGQRVIRKQSH